MEYFKNILWLLSWPAIIYISYRASLYALKRFEINLKNESAGTKEKQDSKI